MRKYKTEWTGNKEGAEFFHSSYLEILEGKNKTADIVTEALWRRETGRPQGLFPKPLLGVEPQVYRGKTFSLFSLHILSLLSFFCASKHVLTISC